MDIENHNTDRKKSVRRKQFRAAVCIAVLAGIVLMVFRYFGFVSKTVYEESVSHLTEVFHQSDNMLSELTNKNLTYLHIWGEYLQNTSDESEIREYIEKAQEDADFCICWIFHTMITNVKKKKHSRSPKQTRELLPSWKVRTLSKRFMYRTRL